MHFNKHYNLGQNQHAFLSASKYAWVNYDDEKMEMVFGQSMAAKRGTELHALAHELIRLGVKLPRSTATLNLYVNDAIGFRMSPEQLLYYSDNAYGTADAISFRREKSVNKLRVHDLKTGQTPTSRTQLDVYCAFFCLEYRHTPFDIEMELRIYQNDGFEIFEGDADKVMHIMELIKRFDKRITQMRLEAEGLV